MEYSDYIVYVDESGDHGLKSVDANYPAFVLAFCIFKKSDYTDSVVPAFQRLKFKYWGHDAVILHEHDIRKSRDGDYSLLSNADKRSSFLADLTGIIQNSPFSIISTVVRKQKLISRYAQPANPYELSLLFCMEELHRWLQKQPGETTKSINLIFECRGKNEDSDLELEFRRICDNQPNCLPTQIDFRSRAYELRFVPKKANCTGLQLADLVARPIGLKALNPAQANRAFDILKDKITLLKTFP